MSSKLMVITIMHEISMCCLYTKLLVLPNCLFSYKEVNAIRVADTAL